METRVCKDCDIEKSLEEYPTYQDRDKNKAYRNSCKVCFNAQKKASKAKLDQERGKIPATSKRAPKRIEVPAPIMDNQLEFIAPMEKIQPIRSNTANQFTDNEVRQIREMISGKFSMSEPTDRSERVARTFNMSPKAMLLIQAKAREKNVSTSDIVNALIFQYVK